MPTAVRSLLLLIALTMVSTSSRAAEADADAGALAAVELGTFRVASASPLGLRLGAGLQIGWPTGATAKLMIRPDQAIQLGVGAFSGLVLTEPAFATSVDWLWHPTTLARSSSWQLHTHVGAGASLVVLGAPGVRTTIPSALYFRGPTQLWTALRVPVGVDLAFTDVPVDVVFDIVPTVLTFPGIGVGVGASLGARWWW